MTHLRKMMLEELQRRNYSEITTRKYLQVVTDFASNLASLPTSSANELRTYQAHLLKARRLTPGTVVNCVSALRFFFAKTLKRHRFRDFLPYPKTGAGCRPCLAGMKSRTLLMRQGHCFDGRCS